MATKVVLVTGANSGIGYETVKVFLQSPNRYHVYLGSRSLQKGKDALEKIRTESPKKAFKVVENGPGRLDVLINNAGGGFDAEFLQGKMSLRECFNKAYGLNTFIPLLLKSAEPRLIFVAGLSQMTQAAEAYFPTPPQPAGWPKKIEFETIGYRCSKTALSMLMLDWNHKLKEDGVKVFSVSPGLCVTGLGGLGADLMKAMGAKHPSKGGQRLITVAEGKRDADAGKIVDKVGLLPW
ncbi:NAD(P)-binding protein [Byssothecium circinans]|uniref:NAD(P)-binding protein n=1 Tax=Byssothecium circinans TaxID=147558 RepID=A0A6A5TYA6_9PLEO|nr:NAD(P)-binding protein [Byssothecium circinans]